MRERREGGARAIQGNQDFHGSTSFAERRFLSAAMPSTPAIMAM
jgi:hypothetical protein